MNDINCLFLVLIMTDINCLYPKDMTPKNINKSDIDRFFEARKLLGNHWSFSLWDAFVLDECTESDESKKYSHIELPEEEDK